MRKSEIVRATESISDPKRMEIWWANLEPTKGDEIQSRKGLRPVLIVSSDRYRSLALKLVIPLTKWKNHFKDKYYHVRIDKDNINNLRETSSASSLHLRSISVDRLKSFMGRVTVDIMEQVLDAIAIAVEMEFEDM